MSGEHDRAILRDKDLIAKAAALHQAGELDGAGEIYREVLALSPQNFDATHLLGVVALQQGKYDVAQRVINAALVMRPNDAAAMVNLGISYLRDGQLEPALQWFEIAVKCQPDSPIALTNAAEVLYHMGRYGDAIPLLQKACTLDPSSHEARNLLGACFKGRIGESIDSFRRGPSFAAPSVEMILSYANALLANGLNEAAVEQLERALVLDGKSLTVRWALALAQLRAIYDSESEVAASRTAFGKSLDDIKSWYERTPAVEAPYNTVGTVQPFALAYQNYNNRDLLKRYGALCAAFMSTLPKRMPADGFPPGDSAGRPAGRKLRLGVVSSHIREHSIWIAVTKGWLQQLDRGKFEILVFHLHRIVDGETEALKRSVDHFDNRTKDLAGWVECIAERELDVILYPEIGSDALTLKLACLRLAPVQAVTWGHPETSGLPTIDLYFSAQAFEPVDAAQTNYSEKLVTLPHLSVYVEPLALPYTDPDLVSLKLPTEQALLLCPGQPFKYAPQYDDVWVQIAKGLQRKSFFRKSSAGRLVFFRSQNETFDRTLEHRLRAAFARGGIEFDAHASIIPFLDHPRFFGLMRGSSLMLDTLGFSGFNTALQGIECDLPVLAFEGDFMRGRLASGILRELELPELVATNTDDFVHKAVTLAKNPEHLRDLKSKIVERRERLFRNLIPVRALEHCLIEACAASHNSP
jgi:predicted O-linked N-acetylglucosamine transferase (SPINDLY family)